MWIDKVYLAVAAMAHMVPVGAGVAISIVATEAATEVTVSPVVTLALQQLGASSDQEERPA